jgi:DNA-binding transcriptional ArsR family regulator
MNGQGKSSVGGWFPIDNRVMDHHGKVIGVYAIGVYAYLARCANNRQEAWPSIPKIAECLSVSERSVMRAIDALESHKLIRVTRSRDGKTANRYKLVRPQRGAPQSPVTDSQEPVPHSHPRGAPQSPEQDPMNKTKNKRDEKTLSPLNGKTKSSPVDDFIRSYPRKQADWSNVLKLWAKNVRDSETATKILDGVEKWKGSKQWQNDSGQFIPTARSFIEKETWREAPVQGKAAINGPAAADTAAKIRQQRLETARQEREATEAQEHARQKGTPFSRRKQGEANDVTKC